MMKLEAVNQWLKVPGRKRLIGSALAQAGIFLAAAFKLVGWACANDVFGGAVCAVHPDGFLHVIQSTADLIQQMPVDLTATGTILWVIGWIHAAKRNVQDGHGLVSAATNATVTPEPCKKAPA